MLSLNTLHAFVVLKSTFKAGRQVSLLSNQTVETIAFEDESVSLCIPESAHRQFVFAENAGDLGVRRGDSSVPCLIQQSV